MESDLQQRLDAIEQRLAEACRRAGRSRHEVQLLAVTKTFGPDVVREAIDAGLDRFGENRVQEARQKIPLVSGRAQWHLIGHLQSNKVRHAVRLFEMIHSVDSLKILETVNAECEKEGKRLPVCLEVNVAAERSKFGMTPADLPVVLESSTRLGRVDVIGLMTIPPFEEDPQEVRRYFAALRDLRDQARAQSGFDLPELSMGMSHDFEAAVEEGATWVRLGSALFGRRSGKQWKPAADDLFDN